MNKFNDTITELNNRIYNPNNLVIKNVHEEKQNSEYAGGIFQLNHRTIRFRMSKVTPNKVGQFVSFWEKDENMQNQAFFYESAPDLLVITCTTDNKLGQFIFPKKILLEKKILRTYLEKGKMAMRVYPIWDTPSSNQAIKTQKWQLPYFIDLSDSEKFSIDKLTNLYS
ncbi:MepB [Clostridium botulinum A2 117]|uniref:MepB family protein n=1 Tax=Clostridium botulinum TaxID=1491 RepID=UPI0007DFE212|nr:MepB family protein [Clostridium botulinum]KEI83209.1 MepB [Clostridium botulinum A2 117]MBN3417103.1 mep operon protein MepB [Clostridium botulinum]MBN3443515.1 mep operon protein MepB [Clostridium botulinum]MBY6807915.1 MepB family protein [Clostridium botulinum]